MYVCRPYLIIPLKKLTYCGIGVQCTQYNLSKCRTFTEIKNIFQIVL